MDSFMMDKEMLEHIAGLMLALSGLFQMDFMYVMHVTHQIA